MKTIKITISEAVSSIENRINQIWEQIQKAPSDSKSLKYDRKLLGELEKLHSVLDNIK